RDAGVPRARVRARTVEGRCPRRAHRDLRRGRRHLQALRAPERGHRAADTSGVEGKNGRERTRRRGTLLMELYDAMRTTFAARQFTDDPLPDDVLAKILDHARFAPSGGNRQGWKVIVVRDQKTKDELARLSGIAPK